MATSTYPTITAAQTTTTNAVFIPEIWLSELIVTREANLVAANSFMRVNHQGKKGDIIHLPFLSDFAAQTKVAATGVIIQANTEGEKTIALDKHKEVSFLIEDIVEFQESYNVRSRMLGKAQYAIDKQMDTDILALYSSLGSTYKVSGADGSTAYALGNQGDLTDEAIRNAIELLDNNDVPENDRFLLIPPCQKSVLLGIDKFVLHQNTNRTKELSQGMFGEIYGMKVKVTTQMPTPDTGVRLAMIAHKDAFACAVQRKPRVQIQYKQEYLAHLCTVDSVYGVQILRGDNTDVTASNYRLSHAVALYVPA